MEAQKKFKGLVKEDYRYVFNGNIETTESLEIDLDMGLFVTGYIKAVGLPVMVGQGGPVRVAGWTGRRVTDAKNLGKTLYSMGPQQLNEVADTLIQNPSSTQIGQALQDAIKNSDNAKKNAILFSIMQNPNLRLSLGGEQDQSKR